MPDRSPDRPPADATRDIKLPPLPGRPAPAVPDGWTRYVPSADGAPAATAAAARPPASFDLPTDRLAPPPDRARSSTLQFSPPPPVQLLKVSVAPRRRHRLLWTLLVLVPLLVIAGAGTWLFMLLNGG